MGWIPRESDPTWPWNFWMVLAIDDQRVAKVDTGSFRSIENIKAEREAYRNLSYLESPYVLRCYELDNPNGLVTRTMHTHDQEAPSVHYNGHKPPESIVKKWVLEAAQGLATCS